MTEFRAPSSQMLWQTARSAPLGPVISAGANGKCAELEYGYGEPLRLFHLTFS